jgi:hypothetical protein
LLGAQEFAQVVRVPDAALEEQQRVLSLRAHAETPLALGTGQAGDLVLGGDARR